MSDLDRFIKLVNAYNSQYNALTRIQNTQDYQRATLDLRRRQLEINQEENKLKNMQWATEQDRKRANDAFNQWARLRTLDLGERRLEQGNRQFQVKVRPQQGREYVTERNIEGLVYSFNNYLAKKYSIGKPDQPNPATTIVPNSPELARMVAQWKAQALVDKVDKHTLDRYGEMIASSYIKAYHPNTEEYDSMSQKGNIGELIRFLGNKINGFQDNQDNSASSGGGGGSAAPTAATTPPVTSTPTTGVEIPIWDAGRLKRSDATARDAIQSYMLSRGEIVGNTDLPIVSYKDPKTGQTWAGNVPENDGYYKALGTEVKNHLTNLRTLSTAMAPDPLPEEKKVALPLATGLANQVTKGATPVAPAATPTAAPTADLTSSIVGKVSKAAGRQVDISEIVSRIKNETRFDWSNGEHISRLQNLGGFTTEEMNHLRTLSTR